MSDRDTSHLVAIQERLSRERQRLEDARNGKERAMRQVWVAQAEQELKDEMEFLGMDTTPPPEMSDDELLSALGM